MYRLSRGSPSTESQKKPTSRRHRGRFAAMRSLTFVDIGTATSSSVEDEELPTTTTAGSLRVDMAKSTWWKQAVLVGYQVGHSPIFAVLSLYYLTLHRVIFRWSRHKLDIWRFSKLCEAVNCTRYPILQGTNEKGRNKVRHRGNYDEKPGIKARSG